MTSNEKKVLAKFREIKQGNTVTMAGTLRVTINYAYDVCNKLCESGYLERLSPGRFALYKITPSGEEQIKEEDEGEKELKTVVDGEEEGKDTIEERDEYECVSCGTVVKEDDTECSKCGVVFEEVVEEEKTAESTHSYQDKPCEESSASAPQSPKDDEEGSDNVDEKAGILNHPSVPEDWKTCNWKWK